MVCRDSQGLCETLAGGFFVPGRRCSCLQHRSRQAVWRVCSPKCASSDLAADERAQLLRTTGAETLYVETAPGYIAINTEYQIKIEHVWATHSYTFSIRGGAYADWTVMFSYVLGIFLSSNYFVNDLDAGDRVTALTFAG